MWKNCDFSEYLDYENCKCRKQLVDKLIDEYTETIEEVKLANITTMELHSLENKNNHKYDSCIVYIVLIIVDFTSFTRIIIFHLLQLVFD